jgi:signal transduction histidine kinase
MLLCKGAIAVSNDQQRETRILVIDDQVGMREGCRRALAPLGYVVDTAEDITSSRNLIGTREFDLFLIDVMLPDGSGLDLWEHIAARDPNALCIIITGFGSIEIAVEAVRRGAYNFLSKPFTSDELTVAVSQALEHRRLKAIEVQASELERARAELEKLDKIKSQLMLKVAHELRAPVAAAQSYVNLILTDYIAEEEIKPTLTRVHERLGELLDMVADLLQLARLKQPQDRSVSDASPQDMATIVKEVCDMFEEQARAKGQNCQLEILGDPIITADRQHLVEIWTNLVSNAIKYTPEGGRISVRLRTEGDFVLGEVEDTGIGIAAQDLTHLFQDFFRTDHAKASGEMGTGLGLSIVKQIVNSYGGEIRVTSELDQGSCFTFILPLDPPLEESAKPGSLTASRPAPGNQAQENEPRHPTAHSDTFIVGSNS